MKNTYRGRTKKAPGRTDTQKLMKSMMIVLAALLLAVNAVGFALSGVLGKIKYLSAEDMRIGDDLDSIVLEDSEDDYVSESDTIDDQKMLEIDEEINEVKTDEDGLVYQEGVTNVLLLGMDGSGKNTLRNNTDVMILVSVNENTRKIVMTSIMRDIYINIPGREKNQKINSACAYGGPALSKATVENAFGVKIDNVVVVDYLAFVDIVEAVGGVEVKRVRGGEVTYINRMVGIMNNKYGYRFKKRFEPIHGPGNDVTLNGAQALGYVRIRIVGNGDYQRTERQREVLTSIIEKIRTSDYRMGTNLILAASKNITTDFEEGELVGIALRASDYKDYDIVSQRIPFDDTYWGGIYNGIWILKIDFDVNREMLYKSIFEEDIDDIRERLKEEREREEDALPSF